MIVDNRNEDELYKLISENNTLKYRVQQLEIELHSLQNTVYEHITDINYLKRNMVDFKELNKIKSSQYNEHIFLSEVINNE